jgi:hypothetical protein
MLIVQILLSIFEHILPIQLIVSLFSKERFHTLQSCGPGDPAFFAFLT